MHPALPCRPPHSSRHPLGVLFLAATVLMLLAAPVPAALVLQESFDYGGSNTSLNGLGSAGGGWGGSWGTQTTTYAGSPSFSESYQAAGLTFSNLAVSGGSAFLSANGNGFITAGRAHTAAVTGTLYGSYLFRTTGATSGGLSSVFAGSSLGQASGSAHFAIEPDGYNSFNGGVITNGAYSYAAGNSVVANETYLMLYKVTDLGGSSVSQSATMWLLRASQYDNFISGGLTEAELDGAALGSGPADVFQRVTRTVTGSASFGSGDLLMLQSYLTANGGQFDELRISDTSLDELVAVPEPGRALLAGLGICLLLLRRQRPL